MLRDLTLAVTRLHILYHAARAPIYGAWMAGELARHGHRLSYGTLYPALHKMQAEGLLAREDRREGGRIRKYYAATPAGRATLAEARRLLAELHLELTDDRGPDPPEA
jgi:DNA-binding PadR family transcriptional regulator